VSYSLARIARLWMAALAAAVVGLGLWRVSPANHPVITGVVVLAPYCLVYLLLTQWMGISTIGSALRALRKR
jgi:type IV secretory pathway protease TraF